MWACSLNARKERDLAKAEKYKAECNIATTAQTDFYSIDSCMDALEAMENIYDAAYIKALEKFNDVDL